jgi:hypothetical protein
MFDNGAELTVDGAEMAAESAIERERFLPAAIRDPRLRAHLWQPYLDRPWDKPGIDTCGGDDLPGTTVAVWQLAYDNAVQLLLMQTERAPAEE